MEDPSKIILEPGGSEATVGGLGAHRYRKPLHKVCWPDVKMLLGESLDCWHQHNAPRLGAALAFYTLLSLMPLLLLAISIAGLALGPRAAESGVLGQIQLLMGPQRAKILQAMLEGRHTSTGGVVATVLGSLALMFGASGVMTELRDALNTIWEVPSVPLSTVQEIAGMLKERIWSILLVLGIGLLLTILLVLTSWVSAIGAVYATALPVHGSVLRVLNAAFSFAVITGLFAAVYKVVPEVPIEWRDVVLGAAVTSLLFTLGNLVLGWYLGRASFSSTYGATGSTIVLAMWVYYSSQVFFLGAEFTRAFAKRYGSDPNQKKGVLFDTPGSPAPALITPGGQ